MGTNYWEDEGYQKHDGPPHKELPPVNDEPRVKHISRDGDGCKGSNGASGDGEAGGGGDDDDDDDDDERKAVAALSLTGDESAVAATGDADKKKKKRKRPKKKKTGSLKQTSPPRVPVHDLFPNGEYPTGQFMKYATPPDQTTRRAQEGELRHAGRPNLDDEAFLQSYRRAAEVHRQTRRWVQETVRPGHTLTEIATGVDDSVRALLGNPGLEAGAALKSGLGFPTGLSLNNCVAHYTPNPGHKDIVLQKEDVMKVDFGVHINGWIVDSAFTMSFDPTYDNLLDAVKDATNTGIKTAGVDVRISDVSAAIQEAMESYEVEIRGKLIPVKAVRNLCGHDIKHWRIHGSKQIPFIRNGDQTKMEEDEIFAIETFGTTGRAYLRDGPGIYGYGLPKNPPKTVSLPMASATRLYKTIRENFGTIVFCRRNLEYLGLEKYLAGLNYLVSNGLLESYEPLVDVPGSYSAQFEHTILLRESKKEVLSRGEDY